EEDLSLPASLVELREAALSHHPGDLARGGLDPGGERRERRHVERAIDSVLRHEPPRRVDDEYHAHVRFAHEVLHGTVERWRDPRPVIGPRGGAAIPRAEPAERPGQARIVRVE